MEKGLPESRFLRAITNIMPVEEIAKRAHIEKDEINVCLGILKSKAAIEIIKENQNSTNVIDY